MVTKAPQTKAEVLEELLEKGMVQVLIDSRIDGVTVPPHLMGDLQLRLNLSRRFGLPLTLADEGVEATLTFQKVPHDCIIPWKAIYAIVSYVTGEPFLFAEDVPLEVVLEADNYSEEQGSINPLSNKAPASTSPSGPALRVVRAEEEGESSVSALESNKSPASSVAAIADDTDEDDPPPASPPTKQRGHLRVVK